MNLRYYIGAILSIPLLPIMYFQGKRIRANVPYLPAAKGSEGKVLADFKNGKSLRLVAIGESTIAGVGVETHEEGLTGSLAKELSLLLETSIHWKVYAESGYTAAAVLEKIIPHINDDDIDIIVIGLGGNDAFTLSSPTQWIQNIRLLIETLQSKFPTTSIVFCNMPPIKEFPAFTPLIKFTIGNLVEILGEELEKLMKDYEAVFYFGELITLNGWIKKYNIDAESSSFFSDGVHPSKLTYQTWAKYIANCISNEDRIRNSLWNEAKGV